MRNSGLLKWAQPGKNNKMANGKTKEGNFKYNGSGDLSSVGVRIWITNESGIQMVQKIMFSFWETAKYRHNIEIIRHGKMCFVFSIQIEDLLFTKRCDYDYGVITTTSWLLIMPSLGPNLLNCCAIWIITLVLSYKQYQTIS